MDRLLARGHRTDTEGDSFARKPSSRRPQHDVEGYAGDGIEMLMHSSTGSRDHNSQPKDTTECTQRTSMEEQARNSFARDPPDTMKTPAYGGYPGTAESIASSEKDVWWEDEGVPGGVFSRMRWRSVFCSRPGFVAMFNHVSATLLGLLIIIAIGLTALGKIRERGQVSDDLPASLAGRIMEAQIVVVKDFEQLDNRPSLRRRLISRAHDASTSSHLAMLNRASKVPVWVAPLVRPDCFDQKCDFKHFGKEYFAFMNPESFGIALPQDWPSLCNSCIEISRNEFVHKTTVRILGDLTSCAANAPPLSPSSSFSSSTQDTVAEPTRAIDTTLSVTPTTTHSPSMTTVIHMASKTLSTTSATTLLTVKTSTLIAPQRPQRMTGLPTPLVRIRATTHQPAATASFQRDGKSFKGQPHPSRSVSTQKNLRQQQRQQHVQRRDDHTINRRDDSIQEDSASTAQLPYLIVDPAAFSNLTRYETQQSLQELTSLHVHFRFVLCDG
ncbi:hypothetical protein BGZ98_009753 [Dissophora globulifera]|nr:hypothetical protein BGZ98_009753 [Dissophora globulifera]